MMASDFSFIIPVFNRPEEIRELLESLLRLQTPKTFEVVIIEDGSTLDAKLIVENFQNDLKIKYLTKPNSGPGDSRNFGMHQASGRYFIMLDSDCLLPENYLNEVIAALNSNYVDGFGGPEIAHENFSDIQHAINFSMTSFLTTGGIRGGKIKNENYQPRSFNMGISKEAFEASGGFSTIRAGEDIDLSLRLKAMGHKLRLVSGAKVFHKRRLSFSSFFKQVYHFGLARPIINRRFPESQRLAYWFPSLFLLGLLSAVVLLIFQFPWIVLCYMVYVLTLVILMMNTTHNLIASILVIPAVLIQFTAYGLGFLLSSFKLVMFKRDESQLFPNLFSKTYD
jgi:GT2 family glycosyltransferase